MNTRHQIAIPCNPANPVDYLACCGLADLLARLERLPKLISEMPENIFRKFWNLLGDFART